MGGRPGRCKTFSPACPYLSVCEGKCGASERLLQSAKLPLQTMQVILSNAILRPDQQLCSLPKGNYLWTRLTKKLPNLSKMAIEAQKQLRLKLAPREFNDTSTCFHGDLMNCNRRKHLSFLNPQVLFLSKCLFTIYSVA